MSDDSVPPGDDRRPPGYPPPMGSMPGAGDEEKRRPHPPQSVQWAAKGMYLGAALSLISVIAGYFSRGNIREAIEKANDLNRHNHKAVLTATQVDSAVSVTVVLIVVVGLIGVALWLVMARTNLAGRGWARIVATVLAVLFVLRTLSAFTQHEGGILDVIVSVIELIVAIAVTVMLYRPDSNQFFAHCRAIRERR